MPDYHHKFDEGGIYHIFNRGNNKSVIFRQPDNYRYFLEKWQKYLNPYSRLLAYCQMPNHFHFLIIVNETDNENSNINFILEEQFKRLFSSYSLAFNKKYSRTGSLFQKRFKRILIDSDDYLTTIIKYIHLNPVHHGFVKSPGNWPYSSYTDIPGHHDSNIDIKNVLSWFGDSVILESIMKWN